MKWSRPFCYHIHSLRQKWKPFQQHFCLGLQCGEVVETTCKVSSSLSVDSLLSSLWPGNVLSAYGEIQSSMNIRCLSFLLHYVTMRVYVSYLKWVYTLVMVSLMINIMASTFSSLVSCDVGVVMSIEWIDWLGKCY